MQHKEFVKSDKHIKKIYLHELFAFIYICIFLLLTSE